MRAIGSIVAGAVLTAVLVGCLVSVAVPVNGQPWMEPDLPVILSWIESMNDMSPTGDKIKPYNDNCVTLASEVIDLIGSGEKPGAVVTGGSQLGAEIVKSTNTIWRVNVADGGVLIATPKKWKPFKPAAADAKSVPGAKAAVDSQIEKGTKHQFIIVRMSDHVTYLCDTWQRVNSQPGCKTLSASDPNQLAFLFGVSINSAEAAAFNENQIYPLAVQFAFLSSELSGAPYQLQNNQLLTKFKTRSLEAARPKDAAGIDRYIKEFQSRDASAVAMVVDYRKRMAAETAAGGGAAAAAAAGAGAGADAFRYEEWKEARALVDAKFPVRSKFGRARMLLARLRSPGMLYVVCCMLHVVC